MANISVYTVTFQQVSIDLIYVYIHTCICMKFGSVRKLASGSCVEQKSPKKTNKNKIKTKDFTQTNLIHLCQNLNVCTGT